MSEPHAVGAVIGSRFRQRLAQEHCGISAALETRKSNRE